MAKNAAVGGTAYLKVNGKQYALRGSFIVSIDKFERESVSGMDGVHGFLEKPRPPRIAADLTFTDGLSPDELRDMSDVTVTAELNNGHTGTVINGWTTNAHEFDASEGKVSVAWEGLDGKWI
tara:strand:+ start:521 stop:886 length:366 start_codon:yes stop_codon:yes gene_type:complete